MVPLPPGRNADHQLYVLLLLLLIVVYDRGCIVKIISWFYNPVCLFLIPYSVQAYATENKMYTNNLATVFGPTLMSAPDVSIGEY